MWISGEFHEHFITEFEFYKSVHSSLIGDHTLTFTKSKILEFHSSLSRSQSSLHPHIELYLRNFIEASPRSFDKGWAKPRIFTPLGFNLSATLRRSLEKEEDQRKKLGSWVTYFKWFFVAPSSSPIQPSSEATSIWEVNLLSLLLVMILLSLCRGCSRHR